MRYVTCTVAIAALAGAVAGCADASYPGSRPSGYNYPAPSYNSPANYGYYPDRYGYYPGRYGYGSSSDYNRNYGGTRSQVTFSLPN